MRHRESRVPEIPELEAMKSALDRRIGGERIASVSVRIPIVIRRPTVDAFIETLTGKTVKETSRRGKYLLLAVNSSHVLAIQLMLTGRLEIVEAGAKLRAKTCWKLAFENGVELRYFGERMDGKVYLVERGALSLIPRFAEMGPDALDPELTFDVFRQRIRRYPGQIKRTLVNDAFISGIGNAYVDEILYQARVYPFTKSRDLTEEQLLAVHEAIRHVYDWAIPIVAERMGDAVNEKVRDFLKVHRRGGQPCPACGGRITEVTPNQRITSYCRTCQPETGRHANRSIFR